ncbi:B3 domain-containing protein Os01g0723500-like isoform X1 [Ipomoea triloba]|uniref:B3 domain-containing protein Os01g0723500-like isoform X1 n=1 Tax=Ipomoea triloba TaxID=35885 RepID=UPI00125E17E6|nr:B3 domain-containing protein Os01g0723500-like isoform X1 [Ipomoea triloba]
MSNGRKPHFLHGFNPSISSEKLKIPSKFAKHMDGVTSGTASLVGPSGNTWYVGVSQLDGGLFFHDGWTIFVKDHCLEYGDSLVFRYDGDFHFHVQVFDEGSCEKEVAFCADCSQDVTNFENHAIKKRDRKSLGLLDCIAEGVPKRMRSTEIHSECQTSGQENQVTSSKEEYLCGELVCLREMEIDGNPLKDFVTIAVPSQGKCVYENSVDATISSWTNDEDVWLSTQEAERAARSFTSSFPNFTKVMKRFNVSGSFTLNVPYQFATEHLPKCKVKIMLRNLKGQSWVVNSIPTTRVQTSHTFCGGWLAFVRDNNLDLGDICIFELVHKGELRVRILRVEKEGVNDHSSVTAHKTVSNEKGKHRSTLKSSFLHTQLNATGGQSVTRKGTSSQDKLGSSTKGCMSLKSAPEEKIAAQAFISSFPHFVRVMKKFNISGSYTLKVPYQFSMEHLPNCRTKIILRNLKGQSWTVNSIPTTRVQTLHTFCGGWMAFVRDNDIQMGDICIFELVGKCEMRVHICAIGKKGLDYQNGSI